jgi:hypothetical protein
MLDELLHSCFLASRASQRTVEVQQCRFYTLLLNVRPRKGRCFLSISVCIYDFRGINTAEKLFKYFQGLHSKSFILLNLWLAGIWMYFRFLFIYFWNVFVDTSVTIYVGPNEFFVQIQRKSGTR